MRIHSLRLVQLNTARAVAILTPHLTARAACVFEPIFYVVIRFEESCVPFTSKLPAITTFTLVTRGPQLLLLGRRVLDAT